MDSPPDDEQIARIALEVEYDGGAFCGWQRQSSPRLETVQATLEAALSHIADQPITVICAGRTDRGVHATGQTVHFESPVDRGNKAWVTGTNSLLPATVKVRWARSVPADFHARFSALSRRYLYLLYESTIDSTHLEGKATRVHYPLNLAAMHQAGQELLGEQDFSAFRAAGCQSSTPWRHVDWLQVRRHGPFTVVDVQANAFLQHMVRNVVGMLLEVGRGQRPPAWAGELLRGRDRTAGPVTAPPQGLYLAQVNYPARFELPDTVPGPMFLQPYP